MLKHLLFTHFWSTMLFFCIFLCMETRKGETLVIIL